MPSASKRIPARLRGKTVKHIAAACTAHRVDRIIDQHVDRPEALRRADMLVAALMTLTRRNPFRHRQR